MKSPSLIPFSSLTLDEPPFELIETPPTSPMKAERSSIDSESVRRQSSSGTTTTSSLTTVDEQCSTSPTRLRKNSSPTPLRAWKHALFNGIESVLTWAQ